MTVEFIGMIGPQEKSEIRPASGPAIDVAFLSHAAQVHEQAGFDRVLVAHHSNDPGRGAGRGAGGVRPPSGSAHDRPPRPGFLQPTWAARQFATFDVLTGGRGGIHIITGGSDAEQRQDGDYLNHDDRYRRSDEYVGLLRRVWTSDEPFDHEGQFYRYERAFSRVKPVQKPHLPIYFGGSSDIAIQVAGRHADVYAFWGETLDQARDTIARVRAAAAEAGRDPQAIRFSLSLRPVLGDTEDAAWDRARSILDKIRQLRGDSFGKGTAKPQSEGSRRLLEAAKGGPVRDKRLWTAVAAAVGCRREHDRPGRHAGTGRGITAGVPRRSASPPS